MCTRLYRYLILLVLAAFACADARATHVVGGEMTYKFLGVTGGGNNYVINLTIYEDCLNGTPSAIEADSLAFLTVDDGNGNLVQFDTLPYTSTSIVPANFSSACVNNIPPTCLRRKDYFLYVTLQPNQSGYTIIYQRCCRNASIINIEQPANIGATYYCTIPPSSLAANNNSAVFNNFPPQIICGHTPLTYDHSATDPDGDSLSYELCNSLMCPNGNNIEGFPFVPPFQYVTYVSPYSYQYPLDAYPPLTIDAKTGIISGTPGLAGRYLITVCCNEWRHGVLINTIKREFQFVVTPCTKKVVADIPLLSTLPNTFELSCASFTVNFVNTSTGASSWLWSFGVPGAPQSQDFQPSFTYPDTGIYSVKLVANPGSNCSDSIVRLVRLYPVFRAQFATTDTQCSGIPVHFLDETVDTTRSTGGWLWYFGDGDTSAVQSPWHTYTTGGVYDVLLADQDGYGCKDTTLRQLLIDNFRPSAGNDTTIVKGQQVQLHATGGISYSWTPADNLEDARAENPLGYFPNDGTFKYAVFVTSPYGCTGYDTVTVTVVDHAAFSVPEAFTPNGDGLNDFFRPYAIGYRSLNYFRIFNRWGQQVYSTTSFEPGWDGTYGNKQADIGTYYWEINYTDRNGITGSLKGDVLLIR